MDLFTKFMLLVTIAAFCSLFALGLYKDCRFYSHVLFGMAMFCVFSMIVLIMGAGR